MSGRPHCRGIDVADHAALVQVVREPTAKDLAVIRELQVLMRSRAGRWHEMRYPRGRGDR